MMRLAPERGTRLCYQINLQRSLGGGEVYTRFFTEALDSLGWQTRLVVVCGAGFWQKLGVDAGRLVEIDDGAELERMLPEQPCLVVTHNILGEELARKIARRYTLAGFVHMPLYERDLKGLPHYDILFAVSNHVLSSMRTKGLGNAYPEPLYAVADLALRGEHRRGGLLACSPYDWDPRKWRDRMLGFAEPLLLRFLSRRSYAKKPGLTLGIVSRLTPIKQFPLLFSILVPVLARFPGVNLEVFGSGGYASVRDLRRVLAPLGPRVRYWGHQSDVRAAYAAVDYVLSGLPEKEALGLNLIEAQACGTPVIAVDAPPFTETVLNGITGHLYADPRSDAGAGFAVLLNRLLAGEQRLTPQDAADHLRRFSVLGFRERVSRALATYNLQHSTEIQG